MHPFFGVWIQARVGELTAPEWKVKECRFVL